MQTKTYDLRAGLIIGGVIITSACLARAMGHDLVRGIVEGILTFGLLYGLLSVKCAGDFFHHLPRKYKGLLLTFVTLMYACHLMGTQLLTFPLVRWGMYTQKADAEEAAYLEFVGINHKEERVPIDINKVFPSNRQSRFTVGFKSRYQKYERRSNSVPQAKKDKFETFPGRIVRGLRNIIYGKNKSVDLKMQLDEGLLWVLKTYNVKHANEPLYAIEVVKGTPDLVGGVGTEEVIWRIDTREAQP